MSIKSNIPNLITLSNLLFGCFSIIYAIKGDVTLSLVFIILAAVMDFMDGFFARLLNAYSNLGKELDSLADLVSFGVAPSFLIYFTLVDLNFSYPSIAFAVCLASAYRLAKFNVDTRQTYNFIGLPTPGNALLIASMIHFSQNSNTNIIGHHYFILTAIIILSYLLVSEIPMFSLKFKDMSIKGNINKIVMISFILIVSIFVIVFELPFSAAPFFAIVFYLCFNLVFYIINYKRELFS